MTSNVDMVYDPRCYSKVFILRSTIRSNRVYMESTSRSCLHSGPGGFYLHIYHRLRDVFFCEVDWTKREGSGMPEEIGNDCSIGCVGGVITLVSCSCLSLLLKRRSVLVY
jgi:hypothetical protein